MGFGRKMRSGDGGSAAENRRKGTLACRFLYIPACNGDNRRIGSKCCDRGLPKGVSSDAGWSTARGATETERRRLPGFVATGDGFGSRTVYEPIKVSVAAVSIRTANILCCARTSSVFSQEAATGVHAHRGTGRCTCHRPANVASHGSRLFCPHAGS